MITSKDCWMKGWCKKYLNERKDCECRVADVYCPKLFRMDRLLSESLLTTAQRQPINLVYDADGTDKDKFYQLNDIRKDIENFVTQGKNLYIHSTTCGNGKTAWSIKLLQAYLEAIWYKSDLTCRALFVNVPRFLLALKDNITVHSDYVEHIKDNVLSADLVVWDEIGIKALTPYEHENLLNLINTRIDEGKSNIYTSNLPCNELREKIGERLYSRVINMSEEVEFRGVDKRGMK